MNEYNQIVKMEKDQKLMFPDFVVTYLGQTSPAQDVPGPKSTGSVSYRSFKISGSALGGETIKIRHGQVPPKPYEYESKAGKFIIYTFKTPNGEHLYPEKLMVVKKTK